MIIFSQMDVWKDKEKSLKSPWKCTSKVLEKSLKKVGNDLWEPCNEISPVQLLTYQQMHNMQLQHVTFCEEFLMSFYCNITIQQLFDWSVIVMS